MPEFKTPKPFHGTFNWLKPTSAFFRILFPDLAEGYDRRKSTEQQAILEAYRRFGKWVRRHLRKRGHGLVRLTDDTLCKLVLRIEEKGLADLFDPSRNVAAAYVDGIIRLVVLEAIREDQRMFCPGQELIAGHAPYGKDGPEIAAERDLIETAMNRYLDLTVKQAWSVRKVYPFIEELPHLDLQESMNEDVDRHRGIRRIRSWLDESSGV